MTGTLNYKGKKVLITGHTGFKGTWLATWLEELGATVYGYSLDIPSQPSMYEILNSNIYYKSDIRNLKCLEDTFEKIKPDIVFHLAAQPIVRKSYTDSRFTIETNVMGTYNVLECINNFDSVKNAVIITSDKCYKHGGLVNKRFKETDELGGNDIYSASKACAEIITESFSTSFFNSRDIIINTARAGNIIGGGDWGLDRLIPDCVKAISMSKDIIIRNPKHTRPFQYVLEPLYGYLLLGSLTNKYNRYNRSWNFGPINSWSVKHIVQIVIEKWGNGNYKIENKNEIFEDIVLNLNSCQAREYLSWYNIYNIDTAIEKTINWYKAYYNNKDMYEYTINEIRDYSKARNL